MKKLIVTIVSILFFSALIFAGGPPKEVKAAFKQKFPHAEKVKWEKEKKDGTEWEASFTVKAATFSANFSEDGAWLKTEQVITASKLPKPVTKAIQKDYAGYKITEAEKVETEENALKYEVKIKSKKEEKELVYDENGVVVAEEE